MQRPLSVLNSYYSRTHLGDRNSGNDNLTIRRSGRRHRGGGGLAVNASNTRGTITTLALALATLLGPLSTSFALAFATGRSSSRRRTGRSRGSHGRCSRRAFTGNLRRGGIECRSTGYAGRRRRGRSLATLRCLASTALTTLTPAKTTDW